MYKKITLLIVAIFISFGVFAQAGISLTATSNNSSPAPWSFTEVTFTLTNNGTSPFYNVSVDLNLDNNLRLKGGDEFSTGTGTVEAFWTNFPKWNLSTLAGGHTAEITLNIFVLGSSASSPVYGQVSAATGTDGNSTPGNGLCCTANEDDEAVFNLNGSNPGGNGKPDMVINYWGNNPAPNQGGTGFVDFRFKNIGTADVTAFNYVVYLSQDQTISGDDVLINSYRYDIPIPSGQTRNVGLSFQLPADISGQYYVLINTDPGNEIDELNENNNLFYRAMYINPDGGGSKADLIVSSITPMPIIDQGGTVPLTFTIKNTGGTAAGNFKYRVHVSSDPIFNQFPQPDPMVIDPTVVSGVAPNGTIDVNTNFQLPAQFYGQYYVLILIDILDEVDESIENNNQGTRPLFIRQVGGIDLRPIIISVPDAVITPDVPGWASTASFSIKNDGTETSGPLQYGAYISRDQLISIDDIYLGPRNTPSLAPGESQIFNQSFSFPEHLTGNFYFILKADVGNGIAETNEGNNLSTRAFKTTTILPPGDGVDLELEFVVPDDLLSPPQWSFFPAVVKVTNKGTQVATGVEVEFRETDLTTYKGGDEANVSQGNFNWVTEVWNVGTILPGNSAMMTVNLFRLSPESFILYSQITAMNEPDIDSTPGDGICCSGISDDESIWVLSSSNANNVGSRSLIADNLGNQPFAIVNAMPNPVADRFNLEVYSNEARISELTVVNILGQLVFREGVELQKGHNAIRVELQNTAAGLHTVRMTPFHPHLRQFKIMKIRD